MSEENENYYCSEWFCEDDQLPDSILDDLENGRQSEIDTNQELIDYYNNLFLLEEQTKNNVIQPCNQ